MKNELNDEMLEQITGGSSLEWLELKAWAIDHNPKWPGKTVDMLSDGPVFSYLSREIPEFGGSCSKDDGPETYFVRNADKTHMNHQEFMALLRERYGH